MTDFTIKKSGMNYKIEICCDSMESAINSMEAGADRIELCTNLYEGGTTPSYGIIDAVRNIKNIGLHVLIRPRGGDFLYSPAEFEIMMKDIEICKRIGVDGVVLGILNPDGTIDKLRTSVLVKQAEPLALTFHRAFDLGNDPFKALDDIISCGVERLLTSGHANKASDGVSLISDLVKYSSGRIIIMPGSGISDTNIETIAKESGAREFHLTGRKLIESEMSFRRESVKMGGNQSEYSRKIADKDMILRIRKILDSISL
jgi:copper homeostasis protein